MNPRLERWRNRLLRRLLQGGQRVGLDITPHHFYSQVPDLRALRGSERWRRPHSMAGVRGAEIDGQLSWVAERCPDELRGELSDVGIWLRACERNGAVGYGPIEALLLSAVVATLRPPRIVQVGAGVSTAVILAAAERSGAGTEVVCIDPHPTGFLTDAAARGEIELVAEPAESVDEGTLLELGEGGVLFVDSTHAVRPGSEVNRIVLDVLPRLTRGTLVHFHDIVFPYDHLPRILEDDLFFWNESPLLQAFLACNDRYAIRASMSMLHDAAPEALQRIIPAYHPVPGENGLASQPMDAERHFPAATWLEVVA